MIEPNRVRGRPEAGGAERSVTRGALLVRRLRFLHANHGVPVRLSPQIPRCLDRREAIEIAREHECIDVEVYSVVVSSCCCVIPVP